MTASQAPKATTSRPRKATPAQAPKAKSRATRGSAGSASRGPAVSSATAPTRRIKTTAGRTPPVAASSTRRRRWVAPAATVASVLSLAVVLSLIGGSQASGAANVVANSSFDAGLQGWYASNGAALSQVTGRSGSAARLTNTGTGPATVALNDQVNSVAKTVAGTEYQADAWVRATKAGAFVSLRLMEYDVKAFKGQGRTSVWLTDTGWHHLRLSYTAATSGASLDLNVVASLLPAGVGIDVDDVTLMDPNGSGRTAAPAATAVPVTPPTVPTDVKPSATVKSPPATSTTVKPPATTTAKPTTPSDSAPAGWKLKWSDEFNGGSVDRSDWNVENNSTYGDGNKELACLMDRPQNVSVGDGVLSLKARKESGLRCGNNDSRFPGGRSYSAAHLTTKGKHDFTYGRFEIRAELPTQAGTSKGLWPAFWLRPESGGTGELDILEAIGSGAGGVEANRVHQTIHYDYVGTHPQEANIYKAPEALSAGMHTYATEWEPGSVRWYVDGKLTYSRSTATTPWLSSAFNKPFYIRLNLSVGGSWPGSPDGSTSFSKPYDIDYVRVYQR